MSLTRVPGSLEALDALDVDLLMLFVCEEDRPPRGVAGLVDWRLAGGLSKMSARGWLLGERHERLLACGSGRLPGLNLLVMGLGPRKGVDEGLLRELAAEACESISSLSCKHLGFAAPAIDGNSNRWVGVLEDTLDSCWTGPLTRVGD